jgi:predicted SnoaL-like aldol condensation-catalyzing enzyme
MGNSEAELNSCERVSLVRRLLMTLSNRQVVAASVELSATTRYHVPGHSRLAGTFTGREAIAAHFQHVFRFAPDPQSIRWVDWMAGTDLVSALVRTTFQHGASEFEGMLCFIFSFGSENEVLEIWLFLDDEAGFDRFVKQSEL